MKRNMYILILMNDFLILNSVTLPNDRVENIKTNTIFKAKMKRKKNNDIFLKNKGIEIEKAEVAKTQVKIIFFRLS
jgi:hypothetical protein